MPPARAVCGVAALLLVQGLLAGCLGGGDGAGPRGPAAAEGAPPGDAPAPGTPQEEGGATGGADRGQRPHVHDYWGGERVVTLMEERVPVMLFHNHLMDEPPREQHTHGCDETLASTSQGGSRKFSLPPGQIVLPGTQALEFFFTWADRGITGIRFLYRPADAHDFVDGGAVASGTVLRIAVTPQMADAGHTTLTKWAFFLCADSSAAPADAAQGEVALSVVAFRAPELPLEPPHPDRWLGFDRLRIAEAAWSATSVSALNKGEGAWLQVPLPQGALVPPGATGVRINVTYGSSSPLAVLDAGDVILYYRDSSVPEWVYRIANAKSDASGGLGFDIAVDHDMVDGVYAQHSNWDLWLRIASRTHTQTGVGHQSAPHHFDGFVQAVVEVARAPDRTGA